jgi:hypothetical protein
MLFALFIARHCPAAKTAYIVVDIAMTTAAVALAWEGVEKQALIARVISDIEMRDGFPGVCGGV